MLVVLQITRVLRKLASEMTEGAEQVAAAASQVSSSSQALAQGASEQAASLEETSSSTEEISSMALRNTENSRQTATIARESVQKFAETNLALDQMTGRVHHRRNAFRPCEAAP